MVTYQLSKYTVTHMYIYIYIIRTYKICNYYIINGNSPIKAMEEVDFMRFYLGVLTWGDSDGSQGDSP